MTNLAKVYGNYYVQDLGARSNIGDNLNEYGDELFRMKYGKVGDYYLNWKRSTNPLGQVPQYMKGSGKGVVNGGFSFLPWTWKGLNLIGGMVEKQKQKPITVKIPTKPKMKNSGGFTLKEFKNLPQDQQKVIIDAFLKKKKVTRTSLMGGRMQGGFSISELISKLLRSVISKDFLDFIDALGANTGGPSIGRDKLAIHTPVYQRYDKSKPSYHYGGKKKD